MISRHGGGINAAFTVRKISYGEGVERVFPVHTPRIARIEVINRGKVRRAKLHYLRQRVGKRALLVETRLSGPSLNFPQRPSPDPGRGVLFEDRRDFRFPMAVSRANFPVCASPFHWSCCYPSP